MKPQTFKQSILAVGIISALGVSGTAFAATSGVDDSFKLTNQASATYQIGGVKQPTVVSNEVVVIVSRQISFTLTPNDKKTVTPDGKVVFVNKLSNKGNVTDEYTIGVSNNSGDNFDYKDVVIKVKKTGETGFTTLPANKKITLEPGQEAEIQITATAVNNEKGQTGDITVTATSKDIPATTAGKIQTAVDTAKTITPVFAITKKASVASIKAGGIIEYTITVENTGNMDATNAKIVDKLPAELEFASNPNIVVKSNNTLANTYTKSTKSNTLTIDNLDIAMNEIITITFDTKVKTTVKVGTEIENIATIIDDPDEDGNTDNKITDSSTSGEPIGDTNDPDGDKNDNKTPSKVTVVNVDVLIEKNEEVTLPPTGHNVFTHTITNKTGGTQSGLKLKLEVDPAADSANITQRIYLDSNNNGQYDSSDKAYSAGANLPPLGNGKSTKIFVVNESNDAAAGDSSTTPWQDNTRIQREVYKISLEGTGAAANASPSVTDKVFIAGLELKKEQVVADCNAVSLTYSSDEVTGAKPGQCIFYKVSATNHLPSTNPANLQNITGLVLSDTIKNLGTTVGKVTYKNDAKGTNVSYAAPVVTDKVGTLAGQGTASLTFSVEINKQ